MQLGQLLGGADFGSGIFSLKSPKSVSIEGLGQELSLSDDQLNTVIEGLGLSIQELSPEMLSLLKQWLAGGAVSPQVAKLLPEIDQNLPPAIMSFADSLEKSLSSKAESISLSQVLNQPSLTESVEGISEKIFSDMAARLSDVMPKFAIDASPNQIQLGAISLVSGDVNGQTFSQTLTNNLLSMAVPQKITDPAWSQAMGDRLVWMVKGDQQMAEIKISPPNLGTVEIKLTINSDQASVSFVSNHAAVRDAIEQAIPRLREMMQDESYTLGHVDVGEEHQQRHADHYGSQGGQSSDMGDENESLTPSILEEMDISDASGLGLIDLFV